MTRTGLTAFMTVVAVVTVAAPGRAQGAGPDILTCAINGNTTSMTRMLPIHNTGTYGSSASAVCLEQDASSVEAGTIEEFNVVSGGAYENVTCGTAMFDGVAYLRPSIDSGVGHSEAPLQFSYRVAFGPPSGTGTVTITGGKHADGAGASGTGILELSPNIEDPDACAPVDVPSGSDPPGDTADDAEAFGFSGSIVLVLPDQGP